MLTVGIIKAFASAVGGGLADQWLEVIEPDSMGDNTVFTRGVTVRRDDKRNSNKKGTEDTISDGSVIHVYPNQFMLLVDGGKVVDYTAEEGYYTVSNASMPSLFNGQFGDALSSTFDRIRYGGVTPTSQKVYYINLQEIKGIKFGTRNPINYFDNFYNAELFLRAHGSYSIKITDPLLFYAEAIPRNSDHVEIQDINEQYISEFLEALQSAINQMSADGIRISFVTSKARELGKYMSDILDEDWNRTRGMQVQSVGIASVSYDEESTKLINMRNQGAMLGDPNVREGYVQGAVARGMEAPTQTAVSPASWEWAWGCRQAAALSARLPRQTSSRSRHSRSVRLSRQPRLQRRNGPAPAARRTPGSSVPPVGSQSPPDGSVLVARQTRGTSALTAGSRRQRRLNAKNAAMNRLPESRLPGSARSAVRRSRQTNDPRTGLKGIPRYSFRACLFFF